MRRLVLKKRAQNALFKVSLLRAQDYSLKEGENFIDDFIDFCNKYAAVNFNFPLCKNDSLKKYKYSCIVFKRKWVVAFKFTKTTLIIHRFIWGPNLK